MNEENINISDEYKEKIKIEMNNLWNRYLDLCEEFQNKMPIYEFGYGLIAYATKMLMQTAPNDKVGFETIQAGVNAGIQMFKMEESDE